MQRTERLTADTGQLDLCDAAWYQRSAAVFSSRRALDLAASAIRRRIRMAFERRRDRYLVTTDKTRLDLRVIHGFLRRSYWAAGIPSEVVERSIRNSLAFGLFYDEEQVGFARVVTDRATFAYLADVFVPEGHTGRGLGGWMVEVVLSHPELQGLRRWMLATADAHGLYKRYGFASLKSPEIFMERHDPDVYKRGSTS